MLTPGTEGIYDTDKLHAQNSPDLAIRRRSYSPSSKNSLVLDKILFAVREDGTIVYEELSRNVHVGDNNIKLITQVKGV